jgi:polyhydroxyalkanoate synthesis regulator phasin
MDSYMNKYLDRRMKFLIEEWDLATRTDLDSFEDRLRAIEDDIEDIGNFETIAETRLAGLEQRVRRLKEMRK